jgi:hypothetical protein
MLHDLPNSTTLAQEIVASFIFSITEILATENHKLDSTFLHVSFGSQSLLKPTSNQAGSDTNWSTKGGDRRGVNGSRIKFFLQELAYIPSSNPNSKTLQEGDEHTNQQCGSDPLEVMNAEEKEWDQSNTWIANCGQNSTQTSG